MSAAKAPSSSSAVAPSQHIAAVQRKLELTRDVMVINMERTHERGQQLEDTEDKSRQVAITAADWDDKAGQVKHVFCVRKWRCYALVSLAVASVVGVIIWRIVAAG